jgi:hypothetical protein
MRSFILFFFVLLAQSAVAQFPTGSYYLIFADNAGILTIDATSLSMVGGLPVYDQVNRTMTLDSAKEENRISIVKAVPLSATSWRVIGKIADTTQLPYGAFDLSLVDPETISLNFRDQEFATQEEAEAHIHDSSMAFGFQFISKTKLHRVMGLKHIRELTPADLVWVMNMAQDSVDGLMKKEEMQQNPALGMFVMMILPMQLTQEGLIAKGYNPYIDKQEVEAVMTKLKEDPDVKKAMQRVGAGEPPEPQE